MLVSWYLPTVGFSLWPCAALLIVFVPVSIWHERNWRRTLADYAQHRHDAGASDERWPSPELAPLMGVQPWLLLAVSALLSLMVALAVWAALLWPSKPPGFEVPLNPLDLPYVWCMVVAGTAAVVACVAVAVDLLGSPWAGVSDCVRRSMYAPADVRAALFARALASDPGVPRDA